MARARKTPPESPHGGFLAGLPTHYLLCRSIGHSYRLDGKERLQGGWRITLECASCGKIETRYFDASFDRASHPRPRYQDGYLAPKGSGRIPRRDALQVLLGPSRWGVSG